MSPPKKLKKNNVISCKCKNVWVNQFPWANMLKSESGEVHHVKCMVYSFVRGKDVVLGSKIDTLEKHVRKAKDLKDMLHLGKKHGEWYVNKKCSHTKNEFAYSKKSCITIVE
jgi:hypothetical protein